MCPPTYRLLDCYRVTGQLAAESFEETMEAIDELRGRAVLIRVLRGATLSSAAEAAHWRKVLKETAAVGHSALAPLADAGATPDGRPWYAADVPGARPLQGPLPVDEALELLTGVAGLLAGLHSAGRAHGDLRPSNILLTESGAVRVLGAGVRQALRQSLAQDPGWPGDARYLASDDPAQMPLDEHADIYGFGLVLFETLTGRPWHDTPGQRTPSPGDPGETRAWLRLRWPLLPEWAVRVLSFCLVDDPSLRYADGRALLAALPPVATPPEQLPAPLPPGGALIVKPEAPPTVPDALPPMLPVDADTVVRLSSMAVMASLPAMLIAAAIAHSWWTFLAAFLVLDLGAVALGTLMTQGLGDAIDLMQGIGKRPTTVWTQIDNKTEMPLRVRLLTDGRDPEFKTVQPGSREIVSVEPGSLVTVLAGDADRSLYECRPESPKEIEIHPDHATVRDPEPV